MPFEGENWDVLLPYAGAGEQYRAHAAHTIILRQAEVQDLLKHRAIFYF
jgi:hypothetical protein